LGFVANLIGAFHVRDVVPVELPDNQVIWAAIERSGPGDVAFDATPRVLSGLTETIRGVAGNIRRAVQDAGPDEVSVEFGIELAASPAGLVAALVGVNGNASVKVTINWKSAAPEPAKD
jgi:Trypsin-co-occurring domain 1